MTTEHNDHPDPEAAAKSIAEEGESVRERVRGLIVDSIRQRTLSLDDVRDTAGQVVDGTVAGLKDSMPDRPDSVLGEVVDGLADGLSATANATRLALQEARSRGEAFAKEDVDKALEDLKSLEEMFTSTVSHLTRRVTSELSGQLKDLGTHAKNTSARLRPAIESAVKEAARHPVEMARDTATTGLKAGPKAAGMLLQAAAGLLAGAADVLTGDKDKEEDS